MTGPLPWLGFGWIGMAVALAGTLGALWNRRLPASARAAVALGLRCVAVGVAAQGLAIWLAPMPGVWWAVAALPIFAGYGLAIPNLLGPALRRYGDCLGRAGALFSLGYYSLLGLLLAATSWLPFGSPALALAWAGWPWPGGPASAARQAVLSSRHAGMRAAVSCGAFHRPIGERRRAPTARSMSTMASWPRSRACHRGCARPCPPRPGWSRRTAAPARSPGTSARHHPG